MHKVNNIFRISGDADWHSTGALKARISEDEVLRVMMMSVTKTAAYASVRGQ
jgi:hypothetical protein